MEERGEHKEGKTSGVTSHLQRARSGLLGGKERKTFPRDASAPREHAPKILKKKRGSRGSVRPSVRPRAAALGKQTGSDGAGHAGPLPFKNQQQIKERLQGRS